MASSRTLAQLRTAVRQRADLEGSQFVQDSELNDYINASAGEYHDLLVETFEDYFMTYTTFTLTSSSNTFALPADFFKFRRLQFEDQASPSGWRKVPKFQLDEMERATNAMRRAYSMAPYRAYRIFGDALWILPEDDATGTYRLWYAHSFQPMITDSDAILDDNGWTEYVVIDAAIKCAIKEETDPSALMAQKAAIKQRIESAAASRDAGEPARIRDVMRGPREPWDNQWP